MGTFKVPPPSSPGGIPVADLVGRLIAVWPLREDIYDTKNGKKPGFRVHIFEIILNGDIIADLVDLGETIFWQDVLLERMRFHDPKDGWYVCRIIRPGKAYIPELPEPHEVELLPKATDMLDQLWQPTDPAHPQVSTDQPEETGQPEPSEDPDPEEPF